MNLLVVQSDHWHLQPAEFVSKKDPIPSRQFGRLAQREPPDLEEADGKLELQLTLNFTSRFPALQEQIIRIAASIPPCRSLKSSKVLSWPAPLLSFAAAGDSLGDGRDAVVPQ